MRVFNVQALLDRGARPCPCLAFRSLRLVLPGAGNRLSARTRCARVSPAAGRRRRKSWRRLGAAGVEQHLDRGPTLRQPRRLSICALRVRSPMGSSCRWSWPVASLVPMSPAHGLETSARIFDSAESVPASTFARESCPARSSLRACETSRPPTAPCRPRAAACVQCASGATDEPCVSRLSPRFLRRATSSGVAPETGLNSELGAARMLAKSFSAIWRPRGCSFHLRSFRVFVPSDNPADWSLTGHIASKRRFQNSAAVFSVKRAIGSAASRNYPRKPGLGR